MKSQIAVYDTHEKAFNAIKELSKYNFPMKRVSLLGKAEIIDDNIQIRSLDPLKNAPIVIGAGAGTIIGLLTGIGTFAIPGFGFLYGAGSIIGALGGLELGLVAGGIVSLLTSLGIDKDSVVTCNERLKEGKFLVIVNGSIDEIEKAKQILNTEGNHLELMD